MADYVPPLRDLTFALGEIADMAALARLDGFAGVLNSRHGVGGELHRFGQ